MRDGPDDPSDYVAPSEPSGDAESVESLIASPMPSEITTGAGHSSDTATLIALLSFKRRDNEITDEHVFHTSFFA
jgi:hypothetical protein